VHSGALAQVTTQQIIQHMVGREVSAIYQRQGLSPGEEMLRVENLGRRGVLDNVSLTLRAGEIVGLAGLMGAGRTELCRAIFGLDPVDSGDIFVRGVRMRRLTPRHAVQAGIALVPEDRQRAGLVAMLPVAWNVTMASLDSTSRFGVLDLKAEARRTSEAIARLRIRCESSRQLAARLSGGNQQKVVISKWLARGARIFLFDEPTRGIDVGAKAEVFDVMDELARSGAAMLMVSSEMPELLQVADRILVMRRGRIAGEAPGHATQEEIMRLAAFEANGKEG
jgi:ABC-type sugar transport system ATPase subunit